MWVRQSTTFGVWFIQSPFFFSLYGFPEEDEDVQLPMLNRVACCFCGGRLVAQGRVDLALIKKKICRAPEVTSNMYKV